MKKRKKPRIAKWKLIVALCGGIAILAFITYLFVASPKVSAPASSSLSTAQPTTSEIVFAPYTANFQIIINGEMRTFTDPRYHNKSADVYIPQEGSRQVQVVVAKPNTTWGDLFKTLPMSVDTNCIVTGIKQTFCNNSSQQLRFYINGTENINALNTVIEPNSQLKIVY